MVHGFLRIGLLASAVACLSSVALGQSNSSVRTSSSFDVQLIAVEDVSKETMVTTFDVARMSGISKSNANKGGKKNLQVEASGSASGGGAVGQFLKPNFGMALTIMGKNRPENEIVEMSTRIRAIDQKGQSIESADTGALVHHFESFEKKHPDACFIYISVPDPKETQLREIQGELLVTPGRRLMVTFEGASPKKIEKDGKAFELISVRLDRDSTKVRMKLPQHEVEKNASNLQAMLRAKLTNAQKAQLLLVDSDGKIYPSQGGMGNGSTNGSNGKEAEELVFSFPPLPKGKEVQSIRVDWKDRQGETERIPFHWRAK